MVGSKLFTRMILSAALAGGFFFIAGAPQARAADKDDACRTRLERSRGQLDRDEARYGPGSRQANRDREKMEADRNWCRGHHFDWDHDRYDGGHYSFQFKIGG